MQASIQSRLAGAMREQGMRSLLLADPENFGYVAGPMLPYVKQTPDRAVLAPVSYTHLTLPTIRLV